jgi:hypothetical protein
VFLVVLTALVFFGPWVATQWLVRFRGMSADGELLQRMILLFKWCFYPCAVFAYVALYCLLKLLFNIKLDNTFITQNVGYLRCISWCCLGVTVITAIGGCFYLPFGVIAIAAAFMGLMLRIVKNVLQSAVEIKEENELTI